MAEPFEAGDSVQCLHPKNTHLTRGKSYPVIQPAGPNDVIIANDDGYPVRYARSRFVSLANQLKEYS